jgi:hypothetical protein
MTYAQHLALPQSKKIVLVEIDAPRLEVWINYQPGIWFTTITPGDTLYTDDRGVTGYWGTQNSQYYNIGSLNVGGEIYSEVASIALCVSTDKSWFYDTATTKMYIHFEDWLTPESFKTVAPGAVIGFTDQIDTTTKNYFEDTYYEPLINSVPNFSKKKDSLFFGILQYQGGSISFDNTGGYFDDFATLDLYGQPARIYLTFEGLAYSSAELVYSGRVEDFAHDFNTFQLNVADKRKLLSRKYPVNVFDTTTYPSMDSKFIGVPIPITFGTVIKAPAYRTSAGNWKFADTTFNAIDAGIVVTTKDNGIANHGGTETDGTFTIPEGTGDGAKTDATGYAVGVSSVTLSSNGTGTILIGDTITFSGDDTLYIITSGDADVSNGGSISFTPTLAKAIAASETAIKIKTFDYFVTFTQSAVDNGLDVIADLLENYEGIDYNATNYDTTEWTAEKASVSDVGIWLGRGNLKSSDEIIEQICTDNQGIFDVLADGRFTFRSFDDTRASATTVQQDELLDDPNIKYDSNEYLSSVKIEYSEDLKEKDPEIYTNTDYQAEVYGRYRQYKERTFETRLTSATDAATLSEAIMEQSKFIYPIINLTTKTQNIDLRVLDNITYTFKRQNGDIVIPEALYQVLGINLNLSNFEVSLTIKYIKDV